MVFVYLSDQFWFLCVLIVASNTILAKTQTEENNNIVDPVRNNANRRDSIKFPNKSDHVESNGFNYSDPNSYIGPSFSNSFEVPHLSYYKAPAAPHSATMTSYGYAPSQMIPYGSPSMNSYSAVSAPINSYASPINRYAVAEPSPLYNNPSVPSSYQSPLPSYGSTINPSQPPYGVPASTDNSGLKKKFTIKALGILFVMALGMVWVLFRTVYFQDASIPGVFTRSNEQDNWNKGPSLFVMASSYDFSNLPTKILNLIDEFTKDDYSRKK